ncbi:MAG: GH92 family glycosyl hydrolase [Bacteroidota bacterium]|nr:GH92 family glycosyl hydrolase [Bacteroidota bacterium]
MRISSKYPATILIFWLLGAGAMAQGNHTPVMSPADYVNPFIGASTSGKPPFGWGKTFPGATTPFGMVQLSPNTITGGDNGSGYSNEHTSIEGFAFTQMSGVGWYGDLGNFLVMPTTGPLETSAGTLENPDEGYRSRFNKESEKAKPGYYTVQLSDYDIKAELTAAPHSGILRFTFPQNQQSRIQIDLARRVGGTSTLQYVKVINDSTISGWMKCTPEGGGWGNGSGHADYTVYFYAQFSKPMVNYGVWSADIPDNIQRKREDVESVAYQQRIAKAKVIPGIREFEGKHLGFYTEFSTTKNEQVLLKSGISFVSMDGAEKNLEAEITGWDFDKIREEAHNSWNKALSKITIQTKNKDQKIVFYTALYHTMIDPRIFTDVDGEYMGGDNKIHHTNAFTKRTIFSGWDVFRSQMPLQTIINPKVVTDMINSLVTLADESGKDYLERWEFLNAYSGCMVGNPAVSVLADAYAKGLRSYNIEDAYRFAKNTCDKFGNSPLGYTPKSVSETLEYAYSEWCLSELARQLKKPADEKKYKLLSMSYKNIFDKEKNSFRPRLANGNFMPWPAKGRLTFNYGCVESNLYQQGWFVPFDIPGLISLMGGREKVIADLDNFFEKTPADFQWNEYYNHSNEPVHHVPYLFNYLGEPWKTQKWVRFICDKAYSVNGLVGDEDVGQMSAWYVLSSSGIYPVCPGATRFEITSPSFDWVDILAGKQSKKFSIITVNNSPKNIYIQSAKLNGKEYGKCFIDYKDIIKGGTLVLVMSDKPNRNWGLEK